jgi:hypothetical protein
VSEPGGDPDWASAWTIAVDALARASVAAAAATAEAQLRQDSASALAGSFADWVFVDLLGRRWARAVAARQPDPAHGAVTIVRGSGRPGIGFVELGVLAQIGELTNAAMQRLTS